MFDFRKLTRNSCSPRWQHIPRETVNEDVLKRALIVAKNCKDNGIYWQRAVEESFIISLGKTEGHLSRPSYFLSSVGY